jgi:hypothetical protein
MLKGNKSRAKTNEDHLKTHQTTPTPEYEDTYSCSNRPVSFFIRTVLLQIGLNRKIF